MKKTIVLFLALLPAILTAQYCDSFGLTLEDELELGCLKNTTTALHDQLGRDYVYASNTEGGFSVLDVSDPENMTSVINLPSSHFENLNVNRVTQEGNYLYAALGSMFGSHDQLSGMAIINVSDPEAPFVTDVWKSEETAGAAYVGVQGHLAYLCALANGVIVLNVADKENISFVSQYIPDTDWPASTDLAKINARNIVLTEGVGYLAYDAGGMRILDLSNPSELTEIGRYSNPAMDGAARAYNNIVKRDNLLYIAVDYAGMEVLDISHPDAITLVGWWNPNDLPLETPAETSTVWFSSEVHTNEIGLIEECNMLFLSGGRTEITALDVSDPSAPELCGTFGDHDDNISAWGMSVYEDRIYIGLICTFGVPFPGVWSGVKSLVYDSDCPLSVEELPNYEIAIFPNPATTKLTVSTNEAVTSIEIFDLQGKLVLHTNHNEEIDVSHFNPGLYVVRVSFDGYALDQKLVIAPGN